MKCPNSVATQTIKQALTWGVKQLNSRPSARLDAEVLLAFVLKTDKSGLYQNPNQLLTSNQLAKYKKLVGKRAKSMPVAYLTRHKDFFGLLFFVNRTVLIPRPETEALVELAIALASKHNTKTIYDIGTGSGNVAVALAKHLPQAKIVASDICQKALAVAKRNAQTHGVAGRIKFIRAPLAEHIKTAQLIVANLPYVPSRYDLAQDILYEPKKSLFAGDDGLDIYRQFFSHKLFKKLSGVCLIELGRRQVEPMRQWLTRQFPHTEISSICGIDRQLIGLQIDFSRSPA